MSIDQIKAKIASIAANLTGDYWWTFTHDKEIWNVWTTDIMELPPIFGDEITIAPGRTQGAHELIIIDTPEPQVA